MQGKTSFIKTLLPLLIVLIWFPNTFMGNEQITKMATGGVHPQMTATKPNSHHSDSVIFETICQHESINISTACDSGTLDDNGKCTLFQLRTSTMGTSKHFTPTNTYQYSHFPCRSWKITDTNEKKIKLHFNGFHAKTCCSKLTIFDGPNSTYIKLFSKTNQRNYLKPVDVESSGNTLFLHYISNISFIPTYLPAFDISYSIVDNDEEFYQYDYTDEEVDYIVLDLPEYGDEDVDYNHVPSQESLSKNPFINLIAKPKQGTNLREQKTNNEINQGTIIQFWQKKKNYINICSYH